MLQLSLAILVSSLTLATCQLTEKLTCPPTLPVEICDASCGPGVECQGKQICCPTECGGSMCVDPVTRRIFVDIVKKGRCPEYPRGPWICSSMCTGDSDCPRKLKCCANRCGAYTCQAPGREEVAPLPDYTN